MRLIRRNRKGKSYLKMTYDYMYEVPLLLSLKQLLNDDFIFSEVRLIRIQFQLVLFVIGYERS